MEKTREKELERGVSLLREKLLAETTGTGDFETAIAGLRLHRRDQMGQMESCIYRPLATVVVQGFKRSVIGSEEYRYGEGHCLISGVDMPSANYITSASPERPFLGISLLLDRSLIRELATAASVEDTVPDMVQNRAHGVGGVSVAAVEEDVLHAFGRLADLLHQPQRREVMAPMLIREIHFCLLTGPQGGFLRQLQAPDSHSSQIAAVVAWLRENFKEPVAVDELARRAHMSTASLHRHFKRVTTLSPLQFQKRLRLYEAQRLMLAQGMDANSASLAVGYESPHQFNREYKRLFGQPPFRDVSGRKGAAGRMQ